MTDKNHSGAFLSGVEYMSLYETSLNSTPSNKNNDDLSGTSTKTSFIPHNGSARPFTPTKVLHIQAIGQSLSSLSWKNELITPIFSPETGRPTYFSIHPDRESGSCGLISADDETGTSIARTTYHLSPGKPTSIRIGADDDLSAETFSINGLGLFTRSVGFETSTAISSGDMRTRKNKLVIGRNLVFLYVISGE